MPAAPGPRSPPPQRTAAPPSPRERGRRPRPPRGNVRNDPVCACLRVPCGAVSCAETRCRWQAIAFELMFDHCLATAVAEHDGLWEEISGLLRREAAASRVEPDAAGAEHQPGPELAAAVLAKLRSPKLTARE